MAEKFLQGGEDVIKERIFIGSDPALSVAMVCDVASQGYVNLHGEKNLFSASHIFHGMKEEKRTHSVVTIRHQRSRDPVPKTSRCVFPVLFVVASNETSLFLLLTFDPVSTWGMKTGINKDH